MEITQQRLAIMRQHQLPPNSGDQKHIAVGNAIDQSMVNDPTSSASIIISTSIANTETSEISANSDSMDSNSLNEIEDL